MAAEQSDRVQFGVAGQLDHDSSTHGDVNVNGNNSENPAVRLTADDGTEMELGNAENAEPAAVGLVRAMAGLDNDLSSVRSLIKSRTPSDVQTIVVDRGDTAQLQQQDHYGQVSAPESPGNDLAGIGGTLHGGEKMEADAKLELSDAESEDEDGLWSLLDDNLVTPPPHDGKRFLPLNELRRIIAKPKVLQATSYNENQQTTRQRMFAILVLTENIGALPSLIDEDLHDAHLPFEDVRDEDRKKWYLCHKGKDGARIPFEGSRKWRNPKVRWFVEKQWHVLSPFFDMKANKPLEYLLEPMVIPPFIEGDEGHRNTIYGGYSAVWRVKIHHAHHNYTHRAEPYFAIKKLFSRDKSAFNQELRALKTFNRHGHPHLTKLLVTYEYHRYRFFLFPWADGNLREFWRKFARPEPSLPLVKWMAEQFSGLASGLELIQHPPRDSVMAEESQYYGRHGDLKPENVLWFSDGDQPNNVPSDGVLKITDFGLTRFHRDITKSKDNAGGVAVSPTYMAPEVDVFDHVSQAYDLWTMGLLLLEFVTWYLKGWKGVDQFSKNRSEDDVGNPCRMDTFYNRGTQNERKVAILKPSVKLTARTLRIRATPPQRSSPTMSTGQMIDPMEDVVALDDLRDDTPTPARRNLVMPPQRSDTMQQALPQQAPETMGLPYQFTSTLTHSPPLSPHYNTSQTSAITENGDEGRLAFKRSREDLLDNNSLGREVKQPKLDANGIVLYESGPGHLRHTQ
ncbi:Serine/threonine-protein kinase ATG1t [Colletotrichum tanaceti]|nr:Serine/threonine-protein kinase ATG1t [Colletotrichum tanaceti]